MPTPFISADATLIQQALYNLIDNAIKYSPMKSNVRVIAEKEASTLRVIVEDDGSGIAPIDQPLLFERFSISMGGKKVLKIMCKGWVWQS